MFSDRDIPHILLVFVDGLGLAPPAAENPITADVCPSIRALLETGSTPLDAHLGVHGTPQSATGQAALLTGRNAPEMMGRHVEGFPGTGLKALVREHSLFQSLATRGLPAAFANAYFVDTIEEVEGARVQSVTTVAALSAFGNVRMKAALARNDAVYQDITRDALRERGYEGPLVEPEEAASHALGIARRHAFTLFEYFQTDRAGHSGDWSQATRVLGLLDRFVGALLSEAAENSVHLVLTSDHGNIEDMSVRGHTHNPVPFATAGQPTARDRQNVRTLLDVAPYILGSLDA